jgi:hypothetical protein
MGRRRLLKTAAAGATLAMAAIATPAAASDGPPMPQASAYAPSPESRGRWVQECSERLSQDSRDQNDHYYDRRDRRARQEQRARERDRARESCERYYDSYYDYYAGHYRAYQPGTQSATFQPRRMQTDACDPSPDCRLDCGETVEYEYVDVPVRAAPRPSKRVRTVPDKRIRLK